MAATDDTTEERTWLHDPAEPGRRVGVRIERPVAAALPRPVAILCHGFKGFMDWGFFPYLSTRLASAGFVAVSLNASGSGVGDDPLVMDDEEAFFRDTYSKQLEDIARVRAFVRELEGVDGEQEVLVGHSRGGGMGIVSAAEDPPAALVTWAAIDDPDRFDEATKALWRASRAPRGSALLLEGADHAFNAKHPLGENRPEALERAISATLAHLSDAGLMPG